jgi:hypothetical protein
MNKKEELLYDVRIAERNIKDGSLSKKDYEKHLDNLLDVEDKGEILIIEDDEINPEIELYQIEEEES